MSKFGTLSPEAFSRKAWELYQMACPDDDAIPAFRHAMSIAKARGMTWIDGMEFAVKFRRGECE
jgi:hypothetical protein